MKVLQVTPTYWPAVRYGGPIRSVRGLTAGLVKQGCEVEVFTTDVDGSGVVDAPRGGPVSLDGASIYYFPAGIGRRLFRSPEMASALRARIAEFDIVHIHAVYLWPGYAAARIASKAGVPYAVSPRGMLSPHLIAGKSSHLKRVWISLIERRTLAKAAVIHVTSTIESAGIRELGLDLAPIIEIANGIEFPEAMPAHADVDAVWGEIPPGARVLFLGRISWEKGIDLLFEAMAGVAGAMLFLAGNDDEVLTPKLEIYATRIGVADRIRFLGPVEGVRKWALLAGADVLVLPSVNENFGIVVAEALSVGTCAICCPEIGSAEILARLDPELVVPRDATLLGHAISSLLADPARRTEIGLRGRAEIEERYTWSALAKRMAEAYETQISRRRSS